MHLFGHADILSVSRMIRMNLIGHVNRMDSKRKVSEVFSSNPHGSRLRERPKNRWWNCIQTYVNY
jgi:hypothetical protein